MSGMLLRNEIRLEEVLVRLLARRPQLTLPELEMLCREYGRSFSSKAFYKELRKLQELGVVVKAQKRYSLALSWCVELSAFTDQVQQNYLKERYSQELLPEKGQQHTWSFSDLTTLNDFWNQLLQLLVRTSTGQSVYGWIPYPWYVFLSQEKEERHNITMKQVPHKAFYIIGGDTYLYRQVEKVYSRGDLVHSFAESDFEEDRQHYRYAIGEFILTVRLSKQFSSQLDTLYSKVRSARDLEPLALVRMLNDQHRTRVTVEHRPSKAVRLRRKIARHFHF